MFPSQTASTAPHLVAPYLSPAVDFHRAVLCVEPSISSADPKPSPCPPPLPRTPRPGTSRTVRRPPARPSGLRSSPSNARTRNPLGTLEPPAPCRRLAPHHDAPSPATTSGLPHPAPPCSMPYGGLTSRSGSAGPTRVLRIHRLAQQVKERANRRECPHVHRRQPPYGRAEGLPDRRLERHMYLRPLHPGVIATPRLVCPSPAVAAPPTRSKTMWSFLPVWTRSSSSRPSARPSKVIGRSRSC